ncbi:Cytochrome c oxidase subunit 6 [Ptychographa xylographoides]|nr:Cytochrome c oxidase subunit 6 [Ptychographa xylographoides]
MSSLQFLRATGRIHTSCLFRSNPTIRWSPVPVGSISACVTPSSFSTSARRRDDKDGQEAADHHEESFEEFTARALPTWELYRRCGLGREAQWLILSGVCRYEKEFDGVRDVFELQRNLNNAFAYDLVPSPSVITAALKAARRVNDYPTAVRIFEGIKAKVENKGQYDEYVRDLKDIREELGVNLKEDLYPEPLFSGKVDAQVS